MSLFESPVCSVKTVLEADKKKCIIKVEEFTVNALLDSGSLVSPVDPETFKGHCVGDLCIHGDTNNYSKALVTLEPSHCSGTFGVRKV